MLSRSQAIQNIFKQHGEQDIYISNTGYLSRAVHNEFPDAHNIFYMQGSMGLAPCIGLGLAKNTDKDVVVLSGDGALLMHYGIVFNIDEANLKNLHVYVLDNGCHESVGSYKCSKLPTNISGINKIIKISCDGKVNRVKWGCQENTNNIKKFINE